MSRERGWHRAVHAQGKCITCWRPNDRLPLVKCAFCARKAAVDRKLASIAKRITLLEEQEEALKAERHELRLEMAKRRISRGNKRGRRHTVGQIGPTPAMRQRLAARQHPWQHAEDASFAERQSRTHG